MVKAKGGSIDLSVALRVIVMLTAALLFTVLVSPVAGIALGGIALLYFLISPSVWNMTLHPDDHGGDETH